MRTLDNILLEEAYFKILKEDENFSPSNTEPQVTPNDFQSLIRSKVSVILNQIQDVIEDTTNELIKSSTEGDVQDISDDVERGIKSEIARYLKEYV
jgi:sugar-specific transcriptional regulator TrmB